MIHNYYMDFLRSFKKFIGTYFPNIETFQFNYADKAYLNYQLYQNHVQQYPMCIVTMNNIMPDDNAAIFRAQAQMMPDSCATLQLLCVNDSTQEAVVMDFKWVTINIQVNINVNNTSDLLDFHDFIITTFPNNFLFYAYDYNSYINVDAQTKSWSSTDTTEGLVFRVFDSTTQGYALYTTSPIFKINSTNVSKVVDGDSSIQMDMEVRMKVPNIIGSKTINNQIIDGIQIVIGMASPSTADAVLPILIDMNNNVYSDLRGRISKVFILGVENFQPTVNTVTIGTDILAQITNKRVAIYMVDDSTIGSPEVIFYEYGLFTSSIDVPLVITLSEDSSISTFNFSSYSILQLMTFN